MGRERQKRKNRSSRPTVRPKLLGRTKAGKKKVNFLGNETIAQNWDRSSTLEQNYRRLGLSTRLNAATAGAQAKKHAEKEMKEPHSLAITSGKKSAHFVPEEVQVERDPSTGRILRVLHPDVENRNPLNDPLNQVDDYEKWEEEDNNHNSKDEKNIVAKLEAEAAEDEAHRLKKKRPRQQSQREEEWISRLVEAHGNDTAAMFRDRKLNPMQQSEGDIAKRLKKWKKSHG